MLYEELHISHLIDSLDNFTALAQWIEHCLRAEGSWVRFQLRASNAGSISGPGREMCRRQLNDVLHIDASLSVSPPPFLSLSQKQNKKCPQVRTNQKGKRIVYKFPFPGKKMKALGRSCQWLLIEVSLSLLSPNTGIHAMMF
uniref:Uncharacterized protein n=1 Tax=Pipistrellus kuhlii TaxID=59472 RepID=A0A7J8B0Y8_PIPKU|nr:hypothetical protein mPipKuh1_007687 [Pipistrellus kuhlii]